jgi:hypothetical protein
MKGISHEDIYALGLHGKDGGYRQVGYINGLDPEGSFKGGRGFKPRQLNPDILVGESIPVIGHNKR